MTEAFTYFDLFAGAGGMALGFDDAGFHCVWSAEMDKHAAETHRQMFPVVPLFEGKLTSGDEGVAAGFLDVDLIVGGVPCQPFSTAGKGLGQYDERDGFPVFLKMVQKHRPFAFCIENVKGLTTKAHRPYLSRIVADLVSAGYTVDWRVFDAADFGVPQRRHRIFIIGFRNDLMELAIQNAVPFSWPEPTHSIEALVAAKWVDGTYWQEHGFTGAPAYVTKSKEEERVLKRLQAGDAEATARVELARWRTVRDAIGDIAGHALPGRTMHSAPVEVESATVALTTTTGDRRVSASGRQSASDLPSDAVQAAHAGHNGHPPVVGLEEAQILSPEQAQKIAQRREELGCIPLSVDRPSLTIDANAARGGTRATDPVYDHMELVGVVANHEPPAPVKASETRPEWLAKHPAADAPSPAVRTGHRDAGTLVVDASALAAADGGAQVGEGISGRLVASGRVRHAARDAVLDSRASSGTAALAGERAESGSGDREHLHEDAGTDGSEGEVCRAISGGHVRDSTQAGPVAQHDPIALSATVQERITSGEVATTLRKHPIRKLDSVSPAVESNLSRGGYYGLVELDGVTVRNIGAGDGDGKRPDEPAPAVPAGSDGQRGLGVFDPNSKHQWTGSEGTTEPGRVHSRPAVMLRRLTVRECARLQDFPDAHVFSGPKTAQYRQVGNAAPRGLVRPIAQAIADFLSQVSESVE